MAELNSTVLKIAYSNPQPDRTAYRPMLWHVDRRDGSNRVICLSPRKVTGITDTLNRLTGRLIVQPV